MGHFELRRKLNDGYCAKQLCGRCSCFPSIHTVQVATCLTKKIAVSRKRTAIEEEILRIAADKFGKQGYQATTLEEIAARGRNLPGGVLPIFP